jgi:hypothetical protein
MRNEVMHAKPAISFLLKTLLKRYGSNQVLCKEIIKITIRVYFAKIAAFRV